MRPDKTAEQYIEQHCETDEDLNLRIKHLLNYETWFWGCFAGQVTSALHYLETLEQNLKPSKC